VVVSKAYRQQVAAARQAGNATAIAAAEARLLELTIGIVLRSLFKAYGNLPVTRVEQPM
jgi:hypothetical protein